jgi:hypothetical protein
MKQSVENTLVDLRNLLDDPHHWTQGEAAKRTDGREVSPEDPWAVCWCVMGGVSRVTKGHDTMDWYNGAIGAISDTLKSNGFTNGIAAWNDDKRRTHADVIAILDLAIERVKTT